jgi:hypothetical protein
MQIAFLPFTFPAILRTNAYKGEVGVVLIEKKPSTREGMD